MVNGRRNKNHIGLLFLDNGICTRDRKEIEEEIINSFSNLYSPEVLDKSIRGGLRLEAYIAKEE